jgi:hypothetical protein
MQLLLAFASNVIDDKISRIATISGQAIDCEKSIVTLQNVFKNTFSLLKMSIDDL